MNTPTEQEAAMEKLLHKMLRWLTLQPEWVFILSQPKAVRKKIAREMADVFTTIPSVMPNEGALNRKQRRAIAKELKKL